MQGKPAHRSSKAISVLLVDAPAPAGLRAVTVDGLIHIARLECERLLCVAVHRAKESGHDAVQGMRQLLKAPVAQVPIIAVRTIHCGD